MRLYPPAHTISRQAIGPEYPLGLTSFPYVDYHPRVPYSIFLGPGGAQREWTRNHVRRLHYRLYATSY